jgi:2-methylcitrate dehydratase
MDVLTEHIAEYAHGLTYADIPPAIVHTARQRILDTVGCALGGRNCEAARISSRLAQGGAPEMYAGRILGSATRTTAEMAAFHNTVMIRFLDFNDAHHAGHPSDMLGALFALAESAGADGRRLISSLVVGYEVTLRVIRATELREKGWDQGVANGIGAAAAVGHLLGLPATAIGHGVSITTVANVPMRASRAGQLSHWKGAATAFAGRNAVFAMLLAAEGMTSPDKPFEGRHGLFEQITGPFELAPFATRAEEFLMPCSKLKYWPVEGTTQAAVWAALELREVMAADDVADIDIATYWSAWHETASEPEKWDPTTRETADHSMPYVFARALLDGPIGVEAFEPAAYTDPSIRPLMQKIRVHVDDEIEATYHSSYPPTYVMRVTATDRNGSVKHVENVNPRGVPQTPMTDDDIHAKFHRLAEPMLGEAQAKAAAAAWFAIDTAASLSPALALLQVK